MNAIAAVVDELSQDRVVVLGSGPELEGVVAACLSRGTQVLVSGGTELRAIEGVELLGDDDDQSLVALKRLDVPVAIVMWSCSAALFQEVLLASPPFAKVIISGHPEEVIDMDFYSTVHCKNLELVFRPPSQTAVIG